jgi:hypothetical protein
LSPKCDFGVAIDARKRVWITRCDPKFVATTETPRPNRLSRFAQKFRFGEIR